MTDNHPQPAVAVTVDARGLACPLPVLKLRKALSAVGPGTMVALLATDRAAARDVPVFCRSAAHEIVATTDDAAGLRFVIRRGA